MENRSVIFECKHQTDWHSKLVLLRVLYQGPRAFNKNKQYEYSRISYLRCVIFNINTIKSIKYVLIWNKTLFYSEIDSIKTSYFLYTSNIFIYNYFVQRSL